MICSGWLRQPDPKVPVEVIFRLAAPILGDEREQAMLDPVPLAGSGRQVTDRDGDAARHQREPVRLALPQTDTHPVAAAWKQLKSVGLDFPQSNGA